MNPFTEHPESNGFSYWTHLQFTLKVVRHIIVVLGAFLLHGLLPCFEIRKCHDLDATSDFLRGCNDDVHTQEEQ